MINIKNLDPNKIKIHEKSYKNILISYIRYVTVKNLNYIKINNSINPLCLIIKKINGYIEESNRNKNLTLVHTDESKDTQKNCEELWNTIRDIVGSVTNNSDNYDKKYMRIKFNSDDNLPLKKS